MPAWSTWGTATADTTTTHRNAAATVRTHSSPSYGLVTPDVRPPSTESSRTESTIPSAHWRGRRAVIEIIVCISMCVCVTAHSTQDCFRHTHEENICVYLFAIYTWMWFSVHLTASLLRRPPDDPAGAFILGSCIRCGPHGSIVDCVRTLLSERASEWLSLECRH